jgi:phage major head subunit gpT-like protein
MLINPAKLDAAFYTFDLSFRQGLQTVTPLWPKVCKTVTSASREMRYAWAANLPGFRKWLQGTERVFNNISGRVYTLTNDHYEDSLEVGADDINDDQLGIYSDGMMLLGVNAGAQPDVLVWATVEAGLTTGVGYDGVTFFSTSHPVSLDNPGLGTYSNLFTTAGGDARLLSAANFSYVRSKLQSRKLENNLPLALGKLTLTVPPALRTTAEQILNLGMFAPATAYGAVAAQASDNALKGAADIVVSPYLTSDTTWYLTAELGPMRPFIYQERQPVKFVPLTNPTDANVFTINTYRYGADVRNASGYSFPQLACACGA